MAVLKRDELISRISGYIGEDNSDDAIQLLEDISDTTDDYEKRAGTDWETKYNELESKYNEMDASWRNRYISRFKSIDVDPDTADVIEVEQQPLPEASDTVDDENEPEEVTIDDLFTEA